MNVSCASLRGLRSHQLVIEGNAAMSEMHNGTKTCSDSPACFAAHDTAANILLSLVVRPAQLAVLSDLHLHPFSIFIGAIPNVH